MALYRYFGLPCAPCHDYGIALYLLLEVGFSTLFFVFIFAARINVNSGMLFTIAFQRNSSAVLFLFTAYGIWNMDFFQASDSAFLCESETVHTWGHNMRLHLCCMATYPDSSSFSCNGKRDFKVAVYPWKFIDRVSCGVVKPWFAQTNLVHIFATFFILSYYKILFVSFSLLKVTYQQQLSHGSTNNLRYSVDPHILYFSPRYLRTVCSSRHYHHYHTWCAAITAPNALPDSLWLEILRW